MTDQRFLATPPRFLWVVNNSLAAARPTSPLLRHRAAGELTQFRRVDELATRVVLLPALPEDPVGHHLLTTLIHAPAGAAT